MSAVISRRHACKDTTQSLASWGGGLLLTKKNKLIAYRYTMPTIAIVVIAGLVPILYSIYISLFNYELTSTEHAFIGLHNYINLITDERFLHASIFTVSFALVATICEVMLGFVIAYLLYSKNIAPKFSSFIRVIILIPYMVAPVVISYTFKTLIYDVNFGYLNAALLELGLPVLNVFSGQWNSSIAVLIMEIFLRTPFTILILYAGLTTISPQLIEASMIDGAGAWTRIKSIILPLLKPVIFVAFVFRFMDALKMFDEMYVLTRGGPGYTTENLSLYVASQGFEFSHLGRASAAAVLFFIIVAVICGLIFKVYQRKEPKRG